MLDHCSISHKGGLVLWSRSFTPQASATAASAASPVNSLIREALIEGKTTDNKYEKDGYSIKWTFVNDLELIFVVAYQRILQLSYVEELLVALKTLFIKLFEPFLAAFVASLHPSSAAAASGKKGTAVTNLWDFSKSFEGWDKLFDKLLKGFEDKAAEERKSRLRPSNSKVSSPPTPPSDDSATSPTEIQAQPQDAELISRNVQALKSRLKGRTASGKRKGGMGKGGEVASGTESDSKSRKPSKQMRKWGDSAPTEDDMASLDFSASPSAASISNSEGLSLSGFVDENSYGKRGKDGLYEVKDWEVSGAGKDDDDDMISSALNSANAPKSNTATTSSGVFSSLFSRFTGSKLLTKEDLEGVLAGMREHLMKKNVAKEIADKICDDVQRGLVGKKVGSFGSVKSEVKIALEDSITRILTPKTSTDLLLSIRSKLSSPSSLSLSQKKDPYSLTFVGVNGVGKSTSLSKVCFWLLQNRYKVLIAACDTFRSGAVEQLRVHVRNLGMLVKDGDGGAVELYERGYGKDAAGIAKEAISYAKENGFDVVLIDTAGRMQDNEPLMRALAKLVSTNNPDKIIFVGEALVGNEAVDQLMKFDRALKDFSSGGAAGKGRGIDGMLVTKWDTVDDKVGAALSMTYVTGQPILFVGCGQTYTDLRQLRVAHIVQALLKD